ncbi:hypothetical protein F2P56_019079 [Juglans regia]|uniref:Uncharacterized protein n=2 Tax=Juglans regia TaxID=51240 RepID=A0A833XB57_JUGRE|nr:uncharacterized protein LOC108986816 [Juglans regia]KAF5463140.1 hypothetical protein F2P56_019079 [Juglans regia]
MVAGASVVCGSYERYLGLPALVGRSKYNSFKVLKDRVWQRISSWKNSFLSQAGKEVLIKAVLQSIPTYTMSVFKLPMKLCKDMNGLFSRFWWRKQHMEGGIQWKKWESLGLQKGKGGLGFRDLESLADNPLFYGEASGQQEILLLEGLRWRVGDGSKIQIWGSKWMPTPTSFSVHSPVSMLREDAKVEELIDKQNRAWDEGRVRAIFSSEEAELILNIPLGRGMAQDKIIWGPSKKGAFTVSSAYYL